MLTVPPHTHTMSLLEPSGQIGRDGITKTVTDRYGYDA